MPSVCIFACKISLILMFFPAHYSMAFALSVILTYLLKMVNLQIRGMPFIFETNQNSCQAVCG